MMQAAVTGCAGFFGSHSTDRPVEAGWSPVGIDCFSPTFDMAFTKWTYLGRLFDSSPVCGDGSAVRDFSCVDHVVAATVAATICGKEGYEILNIAGGSLVRVSTIISLVVLVLGVMFKIQHRPRAAGNPNRTGGAVIRIEALTRWGFAQELADGLPAQVDWLRSTDPCDSVPGLKTLQSFLPCS